MKTGRIRLLYVIDELDIGGTEQQLLELLTDLDRARYEPVVVCFRNRGRIANEIEALGVPVVLIAKRGAFDPLFALGLIRFIWVSRPRIVQTFLFTANTWGRIAAWLCRVPVIIACERNVDVWKGRLHRWVDRRLARRTTCLVTNAEAIKRFLIEEEGIAPRGIRVIYNGVRAQRFEAMPSRTPSVARPVIGVIGRLEPQKDHRTCFRAFARVRPEHPNASLHVIGDGALREALRHEAQGLGLGDAIEFTGATRDVAMTLTGLDLVVVSSTREGCANVILEAMAAGKPVVATTVGGNPELLEDGVSGLLVPPGDPEALAAAMKRLLGDQALAKALSFHARRRIYDQFSSEIMVRAYDRLYQELLAPPVKICYIIDDLGMGGAQQQLRWLLQDLDRSRFEPVVVSLSTDNVTFREPIRRLGIEVVTIPQHGAIDARALWRLFRILRGGRFTIVQTCLFTADVYGRVAAWLAGVPIRITSVRSIDTDKPPHYVWADRVLAPLTHRFIVNADCVGAVLKQRERIRVEKIRRIYNGMLERLR